VVLRTREFDQSAHEAKQMTTANAVGAVSSEAAEWYAIDWQTINQNVRRLQVRIVQATKESRWGKVKSLQRLLTHSYSGKVLAVRRATTTRNYKGRVYHTPSSAAPSVSAIRSATKPSATSPISRFR
jgi:RNA-directed DNA polymerase